MLSFEVIQSSEQRKCVYLGCLGSKKNGKWTSLSAHYQFFTKTTECSFKDVILLPPASHHTRLIIFVIWPRWFVKHYYISMDSYQCCTSVKYQGICSYAVKQTYGWDRGLEAGGGWGSTGPAIYTYLLESHLGTVLLFFDWTLLQIYITLTALQDVSAPMGNNWWCLNKTFYTQMCC